ncbi:hypothetical protein [Streptomyces avermitilis]|uniref:hypothetical protein n=1 Tax=Streptomyces avermitilis TaxID=33903 RepID=UPI0033B1FC50
MAFDLLRPAGTDTTAWPYRRRRAALEALFTEQDLSGPWALCPSTTDPGVTVECLFWSAIGMEGLIFEQLGPVRRIM